MDMLPVRNIIPGPLPDFSDVFKQWFSVIERYCEARVWEDVPWWYNERASLSLFAMAIWKSGGITLEEYSTSKSHKRERWSGRGDLYAKIGSKEYVIEAKQTWSSISTRANKPNNKSENALYGARLAAGETKSWKFLGSGLGYCDLVQSIKKLTNHTGGQAIVIK